MAGAHKKQHAINSGDDHVGGTNNTVIGTNGSGNLTEVGYGTAATGSNLVLREADGNVTLPGTGTPAVGSEAISVDQAQQAIDAAVQGLQVKPPVQVGNMIDDSLVTAPGGPATGDAYVVGGTGGLWSGFSVGDIVVWDGAAWQLVLANAAGVPPDQTRVLVTGYGSGTAAGSFVGQGDSTATYTTGSGWAFTAPTDGCSVLIIGENEPFENSKWVYDSSPAGWNIFMAGNPAHNSTTGLQGGSVSERYHLTLAEHTRSLNHKADFALAGTEPVAGDYTTGGLSNSGDWAFGYGTGGAVFLLARINATNIAVELTAVT